MITGFSMSALDQLAGALGGGGGGRSVDLTPLVDAMNRLNATASDLLDAVENPRATNADELFRRGHEALRRNWVDDAIRDLEESLRVNPYRSGSYLLLAIGKSHRDDALQTMAHLVDALKYAEAGEYRVGVTAALAGAYLAEASGGREGSSVALDLLHRASQLGAGCPEIVEAILLRRPTSHLQELYVRWFLASHGNEEELSDEVAGERFVEAREVLRHAVKSMLPTAKSIEQIRARMVDFVTSQPRWPSPPGSVSFGDIPSGLQNVALLTASEELTNAIRVSEDCVAQEFGSVRLLIRSGFGLLHAALRAHGSVAESLSRTDHKIGELEKLVGSLDGERRNHQGLVPSTPRIIRKELKTRVVYLSTLLPTMKAHATQMKAIANQLPQRDSLRTEDWITIFPDPTEDLIRPLTDLPLSPSKWRSTAP